MGRQQFLDIFKGLLTLGMVHAHLIHFLGQKTEVLEKSVLWWVNAVTFHGFVFSFGYVSFLAYFSRPQSEMRRSVLKNTGRLLIAYYISALAYVLLLSSELPTLKTLLRLLLLFDIAPFSEFLLAFMLFALLPLVAYRAIHYLLERPALLTTTIGILLFTTFLPYEMVSSTHIGLLIGTPRSASFPILQYLPVYLVGCWFARSKTPFSEKVIFGSFLSAIPYFLAIAYAPAFGERFPPSIGWILLPWGGVFSLLWCSQWLESRQGTVIAWVNTTLESIGKNTLVYLLSANIITFALAAQPKFAGLSHWVVFFLTLLITGKTAFLTQLVARSR